MSEEILRAFFTAYGHALATGDLETIAERYVLPALVLSDAGSIPLGTPEQIAAAADAAARHYADQGIAAIQPRLTRLDPISATLTEVDVTWLYQTASGKTLFEERYRYLLREVDGEPLIQVVVSRPVM
jgi:hypothetical protein